VVKKGETLPKASKFCSWLTCGVSFIEMFALHVFP